MSKIWMKIKMSHLIMKCLMNSKVGLIWWNRDFWEIEIEMIVSDREEWVWNRDKRDNYFNQI